MLLTPEHHQIADTVRKFVAKELNPFVDAWEAQEEFPSHEVMKKPACWVSSVSPIPSSTAGPASTSPTPR